MKLLFTILFTLISIFSIGQFPISFYNLSAKANHTVPSNIKNPSFVDTNTFYEAFGFIERTGVDRITDFTRIGTGHLTGGNVYMRNYYVSSNLWADSINIERNDTDCRDVWGGRMDNDSIVLFTGRSLSGIGGSSPSNWGINLYMLRGDTNGHFGSRVYFNWGAYPRLERGYWFGHITKGGSAGEYYIELNQFNVDTGTLSRVIISVVKTTDYFRTYTINTVFNGTGFQVSEGAVVYLGNNKMLLLLRQDNGGPLYDYQSTDAGVTWTAKGSSNLFWYAAGGANIPYIYKDTIAHKINIPYQDRDNDFIELSQNNDTATFFNNQTSFNNPQLYFYNQSENHAVANSSLGYPSMINILGDSVFMILWAHETAANKANNMFSRDNFTWTIAPIAPPTITSSSITTTSFRVDISGYTTTQLNNVQYFQFDVSTDPAFGSFVTAKYRTPSLGGFSGGLVPTLLQNIYMNSQWDIFNALTTGTTYYIRIKACNPIGCSSYTTINVTTS